MAQKVITTYVDDLTGEEAEEISTHTILVDGAGVEIDLSLDNHDKLLAALEPFLSAKGARRVRGPIASRGGKGKRTSGASAGQRDTAAIRAWAKDNGYDVNERGRVPASLVEAYEKAR